MEVQADRCGRGHLTWLMEPPCEVCDLLDFAEEFGAYVPEYFKEKWEFESRLRVLKGRLAFINGAECRACSSDAPFLAHTCKPSASKAGVKP